MKNKLGGWSELAENKIAQDLWQDALDLLEKLAKLDPPYVRGLHLLGRCHMKLGQFEQASKAFGQAKVMNPFNLERLLALGQSLLFSDHVSEAKEVYREARVLAPQSNEAIKGQGQCLLLEGEVNEALAVLKEITDGRELAAVFNGAAILAMRRGQFEQGIALYDTAVKAIGSNSEIKARLYFNKAIGYRRWQKDAQALSCLEQAMRNDQTYDKAKILFVLLAKKLGLPVPSHLQAFAGVAAPPLSATSGDYGELAAFDGRQPTTTKPGGGARATFGGDFDLALDDEFEDDALAFL